MEPELYENDSEDEFIDDSQFEDSDGYVDSITEDELVGDILELQPEESDSLDTVIIVDNVPVVGPDRLEKLKMIIRKVFSKFGNIVNEFYPQENDETKGFIFLEFSDASDAANAVKTANGYKLDKNHTFQVNAFADFERYKGLKDEWVAPEKRLFKDMGNLQSFLLESDGNDQYSVIYNGGGKVSIFQNGLNAPTTLKERDNWTETFVTWSPKGTYLATVHYQGIALWGGEDFQRLYRFNHTNVQIIDFSPCERYVVTCTQIQDMHSQESSAIIIWDIKHGTKMRGFGAGGGQWPVLKWSSDGNYVARIGSESLSVYEAPSFGLLEKKSIKIPGLKDFSWSPSQNVIAYWVPENKDAPARVCIMEMPSRTEIRVKNLFNVHECKMCWQKNGDYLCVKVERYTKSRKVIYFNLELFRMKEKNIPVDTLEIKEPITAFEWEPNGSRFCIIHGETPRISASFYQVEEKQLGQVTLVKQFEKKTCNTISWCPTGQFCVLAGLSSNGLMEFIDTADMLIMNSGDHYMATDVLWDPTGRYFVSALSWWRHKVDNGYFVWSFQGKVLQRQLLKDFCHFLWRPRPPTLLSEKSISSIKKDLKRYQKVFEKKDRVSQNKASQELIDKRRSLFSEFAAFRRQHQELFEKYKQIRIQLRNGLDTDSLESDFDEIEEETIEFFVREETEIIESKEE